MRRILPIFVFFCFFSVLLVNAKKKKNEKANLVKISTLFKNAGKAISKNPNTAAAAEKELIAALTREDVTEKQRAKIYFTSARLQECQNGIINKNAYLKNTYDTAAFFNPLLTMFQYLDKCDSVDAIPDSVTGKIRLKFASKTRSLRKKHLINILNGGKFFLSKKNYLNAYSYFDFYLRYSPDSLSADYMKYARWATLSAYLSKSPQKTLRFIDLAITSSDSIHKPLFQEYKAKSYLMLNDEKMWLLSLDEGIKNYPSYDFFFVNRLDAYYSLHQFSQAYSLSDKMLELVGSKPLYWFAKCKIALAESKYDKCIEYADSTINLDNKYVDAYYNKGVSYLNLAVIAQETACNDLTDPKCQEDHRNIKGFYQMAKPCMEMVQKLQPENIERWGNALYRIYLNLNMGEEFDQIDKLLNQHHESKANKG